MTKEDVKKLKFTNLEWLYSKHQADYMLGFLRCKNEVIKLLEKEENKNGQ